MAISDTTAPRGAGAAFRAALHSEWIRLRRSPLVALHAALSASLGLAAGLYFAFTPWNALLGFDAFVQLLGAGAPLLAGMACGLSLDSEREAGEYANLLGRPSRRAALAAKGCALLLLGIAACVVATTLFSAVMAAVGRPLPSLAAMAASCCGASAGSVALYSLFIAAALAWGRNAAIGLGALGFMCALASLGGLGNGLVTNTLSAASTPFAFVVVPFTWATRLASLCIELSIAGTGSVAAAQGAFEALSASTLEAGAVCAIGTAAITIALLAGANRFEDVHRARD